MRFLVPFLFILCNVEASQPGPEQGQEILKYRFPAELGMPKLSRSEVLALRGKDPEVLRNKINTAYDLLHYMILADYGLQSGDLRLEKDGIVWHYNKGARQSLIENGGNCGATANMVNYLLEGDYEEVGYVAYAAQQGGHIFNYIKSKGKYFVIDFLQYVLKDYKNTEYHKYIYQSDSLRGYPEHCIKSYGRTEKIKVVVSYQAKSQIPVAEDPVTRTHTVFPHGSKIGILYDKEGDETEIKYLLCPKELQSSE